jgi:hypothetical protein
MDALPPRSVRLTAQHAAPVNEVVVRNIRGPEFREYGTRAPPID